MLPGVFCHWGYIGLGFIDLLAVVPCRKTAVSAGALPWERWPSCCIFSHGRARSVGLLATCFWVTFQVGLLLFQYSVSEVILFTFY